MSTLTSALASARRDAVVSEPKARIVDLIAAEWTKMWSLRSTRYLVPLTVLAIIAINAFLVQSDFYYIDHPFKPFTGPDGRLITPPRYDALRNGLSPIGADLVMIVLGCVGGIAIFGEYATGQIRTTFASVPQRNGVTLAKFVVVGVVTTVAGFAAAFGSFFLTNAMLASRHVGLSINDPGCWRAVCGYALLAPVSALIGMMIAALVRHGSGTIVAVIVFLEIVPLFFGGDRFKLLKEIGHYLPRSAWSKLSENPAAHYAPEKYPATNTSSWIAYGLWIVVSLVVTTIVVKRRDV